MILKKTEMSVHERKKRKEKTKRKKKKKRDDARYL